MSSDGKVDIIFGAEQRQALAAWQTQHKAGEKMIRLLERIERVSKNSSQNFGNSGRGMQPLLGDLTKVVATLGAAGLAMRQIRLELQAINQEKIGAGLAQTNYFAAVSGALRNSGNLFADDNGQNAARNLDAVVKRIGKQTNQSPAKVAATIDSVLSARGAVTKEQANASLETLAAVLADTPELDIPTTSIRAGSVEDLRSKFGWTPEQALGLVHKLGQTSRVVDPLQQAEHLVPGVANLTSFGLDPMQAGALISAGTQGMKDYSGRISSHAMQSFARELEERLPGEKDFMARLEKMRDNPKWQEAYFAGGMINGKKFDKADIGEGKSIPTIKGLFDRGSLDSKRFAENLKDIGTLDDLGKITQRHREEIKRITGAATEEVKRTGEAVQEQIRLQNERGALGAATEKAATDIMTAAGMTQFEVTTAIFNARVGSGTPKGQIKRLAEQMEQNAAELRKGEELGSLYKDVTPGMSAPSEMLALTVMNPWRATKELYRRGVNLFSGMTPASKEQLDRANQMEEAGKKLRGIYQEQAPEEFARDEEIRLGINKRRSFTAEELERFRRQRAAAKRRPDATFGNTIFNPEYNRAERFPAEGAAYRESKRITDELEARADLFGEFTPEESSRLRNRTNKLQGNVNRLDSYFRTEDLQLRIDALVDALNKNTAATKGNTTETKKAPAGEPQAYRPTSQRLNRGTV